MSIALWFEPRKHTPLHDTLTALMQSLQSLFPDAPAFEPHLTVTNDIVVENPAEVSKTLRWAAAALEVLRHGPAVPDSAPGTTTREGGSKAPRGTAPLVTLASFHTGKTAYTKLHLTVVQTASLISFAQIVRELTVEAPRLRATRERTTSDNELNRAAAAAAATWATHVFNPHVSLVYSHVYSVNPALLRTVETRIRDALNVESLADLAPHEYGWSDGVLRLMRCEGPVSEWVELGSLDVHV